jgi:hypothetical protein
MSTSSTSRRSPLRRRSSSVNPLRENSSSRGRAVDTVRRDQRAEVLEPVQLPITDGRLCALGLTDRQDRVALPGPLPDDHHVQFVALPVPGTGKDRGLHDAGRPPSVSVPACHKHRCRASSSKCGPYIFARTVSALSCQTRSPPPPTRSASFGGDQQLVQPQHRLGDPVDRAPVPERVVHPLDPRSCAELRATAIWSGSRAIPTMRRARRARRDRARRRRPRTRHPGRTSRAGGGSSRNGRNIRASRSLT